MQTLNLFPRKQKASKLAARAHRGDVGVTIGTETPSGLFGSITWAVNVASRRFTKVKANAFVNHLCYNRFELINLVNGLTKPYIIASPKDLMDMNVIPYTPANKCLLTNVKKIIWAIDYTKSNNSLTLMPVR